MKADKSRMAWACRRGMLECELFLLPFVDRHFESLSEGEQAKLYDLLQYPDPVLYDWLMGKITPQGPDPEFASLITKIRDSKNQ